MGSASLQAHLASMILKRRVKARLHGQTEVEPVRRMMKPPPFRVPRGVRITPDTVGGVPGEWVEAAATAGTLLYIHGGGYFTCSPKTHRPITTWFARHAGFRVFAPDYRLAPEHVFPAAVDDVRSVYEALDQKLVVAGDSAGGGLSLAMLVALRDAGRPLPAAAALFSPWTDLAATGESLVCNDKSCAMFHGDDIATSAKVYLGGADPRHPLASPLYADLTGLPPLLIHAGEHEVLRDDSVRLAERARAAGVKVELKLWPVVPHVWQILPSLIPEARASLRETAEFLRRALVGTA